MQEGAWCPRSSEDVGLIMGQTAGQRDLGRGGSRPRGAAGTKGAEAETETGTLCKWLHPYAFAKKTPLMGEPASGRSVPCRPGLGRDERLQKRREGIPTVGGVWPRPIPVSNGPSQEGEKACAFRAAASLGQGPCPLVLWPRWHQSELCTLGRLHSHHSPHLGDKRGRVVTSREYPPPNPLIKLPLPYKFPGESSCSH